MFEWLNTFGPGLAPSSTLGTPKLVLLWRIIIPQGFRATSLAISTRLIHNIKNTQAVIHLPKDRIHLIPCSPKEPQNERSIQ